MAVELLQRLRAGVFVKYAMDHDLQIQLNRRQAARLLVDSLANEDDSAELLIEWQAESFDKMHTFLLENDQQVHYQGNSTVGVYAIVRLLGELRRVLRDTLSQAVMHSRGSPLLSPTKRGVARGAVVDVTPERPSVSRSLFRPSEA